MKYLITLLVVAFTMPFLGPVLPILGGIAYLMYSSTSDKPAGTKRSDADYFLVGIVTSVIELFFAPMIKKGRDKVNPSEPGADVDDEQG